MVEETLKNMPGSVMKIAELKRALPKQVHHDTLKIILSYLEENNKIVFSIKGITWLVNEHESFKKILENSYEWTPEGFRKFQPNTHKKNIITTKA
jgi:hypothetical protein